MKLARKLTEEGATTFNTANAKAMAAYYTEDAKIFFETKNDSGVSVKEYNGRDEIEKVLCRPVQGSHHDPVEEHGRVCQAAGPRHPGDRGNVRAQLARPEATQSAVLPGANQTG